MEDNRPSVLSRFMMWFQKDRISPAKHAAISRFFRYVGYQIIGIISANLVVGLVYIMLALQVDPVTVGVMQVVFTAGSAAITRGVKYAKTGVPPEPVEPVSIPMPQNVPSADEALAQVFNKKENSQ